MENTGQQPTINTGFIRPSYIGESPLGRRGFRVRQVTDWHRLLFDGILGDVSRQGSAQKDGALLGIVAAMLIGRRPKYDAPLPNPAAEITGLTARRRDEAGLHFTLAMLYAVAPAAPTQN